jgi:hypothetical protein
MITLISLLLDVSENFTSQSRLRPKKSVGAFFIFMLLQFTSYTNESSTNQNINKSLY